MFLPLASRRGGSLLGTLFALAAILACPNRAGATVLRRLTIAELAAQSAVIVRARVRESHAAWNQDPNHRRIVTYTTVEVVTWVRGTGPRLLRIRQIGGAVGDVHAAVLGNARFDQSEDALLFLSTDASGDYFVVGMAQGKFHLRIDPATGETFAERDFQGAAFLEPDPSGRPVVRTGVPDVTRRLADLLVEVRAAIGGVR